MYLGFSAISITKIQCCLQHCFYLRFLGEGGNSVIGDTLEVVVRVSRLWYKVYDLSLVGNILWLPCC